MDFDPGQLYDDDYEDSLEDNTPELEEEIESNTTEEKDVEYDELGNPIFLAAAAGFGHHMSENDNYKQEQSSSTKKEFTKIPLKKRKEKKGYMTPFGRWATNANIDPGRSKEEIKYTKKELLEINRLEGE